eukprot:scaffold405881_cov23-Prasinocladus_malaysianus.AAC.2
MAKGALVGPLQSLSFDPRSSKVGVSQVIQLHRQAPLLIMAMSPGNPFVFDITQTTNGKCKLIQPVVLCIDFMSSSADETLFKEVRVIGGAGGSSSQTLGGINA